MGRVCVGRLCYGPSLQWAEFAMSRDVQLPRKVAGHSVIQHGKLTGPQKLFPIRNMAGYTYLNINKNKDCVDGVLAEHFD